MARPRKLSELQLEQIKHHLAMIPLRYYTQALQSTAKACKVSLRTLRRRLKLERKNKYGRKTKQEKHRELGELRKQVTAFNQA
jgi:hypothetical protein